MSDSYVTSQATIKCSCGDRTVKLIVYPDRTVFLTGKPMANISDHISLYNIPPFGRCHTTRYPATGAATAANKGKLTPMPCIPGTVSDWINGKDDYIIKGNPALLKSSYCRCKWGGVITITDDGQIDTGSADLSRENATSEEEMKVESEKKLKVEPESVLDGIQLALDAAGLVPGFGAIPDLLNASISAIRGDWVAAGLSVLAAVPIIGDAATAAKFAQKGIRNVNRAKKIKSFKAAIKNNDAKFFIDKNISQRQLIKNGMSTEEANKFLKSVRMERKKVARDFFRKNNKDMPNTYSHINCIDTNKPIYIKKVPPPNQVIRYEHPNANRFGEYATFPTTPPPKPEDLGILSYVKDADGNITDKVLREYEINGTEQFEVLQSTAKSTKAPVDGNWNNKNTDEWVEVLGGGTQVYVPIKNKDRFKVAS